MTTQNPIQKKNQVLRATAPVAGVLGVGTAAFLAAAWWISEPTVEVASVAPLAVTAPAPTPEIAPTVTPTPEVPASDPSPEVPAIVLGVAGDPEADHLELALEALEVGNPDGALLALRQYLHHHEATVDVLIRVGRLARELGRLELAAAALEEARGMDSMEPEVAIQRARVALDAGEVATAQAAATRAVRLSPEESLTWNLLGRAEMAASRWEASEMAFDRAVALDPANPWLNNNRGLLYVYMKRGRDAVDALETSVALFGEDVPHHVFNNLGLALEIEGRVEDARAAFEEALAVSPFYVKARVNLRRMEAQLEERLASAAHRVAEGAFPTAEPLEEESERAAEEVAADSDKETADTVEAPVSELSEGEDEMALYGEE